MKKVVCSILIIVMCVCGVFVNGFYASAAVSYGNMTESGYCYTVTIEDEKPPYWVISTPDETRPTYEYTTIDARHLGVLLKRFSDEVDKLKELEEDYEKQVKTVVIKLIPLTLASSVVPGKYVLAKKLAKFLPGFSVDDVEEAMELYNDIIESREACEQKFDCITYTISR